MSVEKHTITGLQSDNKVNLPILQHRIVIKTITYE
jgi:hypothetical protein